MAKGQGKGGMAATLVGQIIVVLGLVIFAFLLSTCFGKDWIHVEVGGTRVAAAGIFDPSSDELETTLGLMCIAIIMTFCATIVGVMIAIGKGSDMICFAGMGLGFLAWLFDLAAWSYFYDKVYDQSHNSLLSFDLAWMFWLAVVCWVLLLPFFLLFFVAKMGLAEGAPAQTATPTPATPTPKPAAAAAASEDLVRGDSLDYHDYNVDDEGNPLAIHDKANKGQFRCAGDSFMEFGFQLTANPKATKPKEQQGHFMCLVEFEASGSEVHFKFEYNMFGADAAAGAGVCAYLLDPSVEGFDTVFDGTGPMGFLNKKGALLGVGFDNNGKFEDKDHVCVKTADGKLLKKVKVDGGFMTGEEDWKTVHVQFDIAELKCDVNLEGKKVLDDVEFPKGFKIPSKLCAAVCGAATDENFMIAVNDVKLEDTEDSDNLHEEIQLVGLQGDQENVAGVPKGCTDYKVEDGSLVASEHEEDWRTAGHATIGYGFELTKDEDDQQGHLLCRVPFEVQGQEIFASLEYVMAPKAFDEGGGQGLCIYLLDPSIPGWDRKFDGSGPLGFVGKTGAILGVGVDCTGTFCEGNPASI
jgi:hypothetical protein